MVVSTCWFFSVDYVWLYSLFCRFHCLSPQILQLFAEFPSVQSVRTSLRVFLLVFNWAPNPRFSISLQLQLPMSCDLAVLILQHVILVRRLDVQSTTGRLTLEFRGCAESATDRTLSLPLVLVLVCSLPEVTQTSFFVSSEGNFNIIA